MGRQDLSRLPGHRAAQGEGLSLQRKGWETANIKFPQDVVR